MNKDPQLEAYRWLDAHEVRPRNPAPPISPTEKAMNKKLNQKLLDFIDKL